MDITPPPGYANLVALDKEQHNGLGIAADPPHRFAAALNCIHLVAAEIVQAARDYPVVFVPLGDSGALVTMAVTGLADDINLFVNDAGEWRKDIYVPAYIRRWPFYGLPIEGDENRKGEILICVDEAALAPSATPLFGSDGQPSPELEAAQQLIAQLEAERVATERLCRDVRRLGLLEPFEALALPKAGNEMRLRGMFRVNEEKLNALPPRDIKQLMKHGELSRIYAHLMSLDNFRILLDRTAERNAAGGN